MSVSCSDLGIVEVYGWRSLVEKQRACLTVSEERVAGVYDGNAVVVGVVVWPW